MKKSSSKKHFLAGVIILVVVIAAFFLGWFTGTNVPLYNNSQCSDSETVDNIPILALEPLRYNHYENCKLER